MYVLFGAFVACCLFWTAAFKKHAAEMFGLVHLSSETAAKRQVIVPSELVLI